MLEAVLQPEGSVPPPLTNVSVLVTVLVCGFWPVVEQWFVDDKRRLDGRVFDEVLYANLALSLALRVGPFVLLHDHALEEVVVSLFSGADVHRTNLLF